MDISFDFGGSTVDSVFWRDGKIHNIKTFESEDVLLTDFEDFLRDSGVSVCGADRIFVTGGKSRFFKDKVLDVPVMKVPEIEAIGQGGVFVHGGDSVLVVSMGTGTCIVSVKSGRKAKHIGGTGVGGGTFLGLSREILGISDLDRVLEIGSCGSARNVDISVREIVGGDIGRISGGATASNLGKLSSEVKFGKEDLAAGIINLIGQTIGAASVFAAQAENVSSIVLVGKLTKAKAITDVIKRIAFGYGIKVFVPKNAEFAPAIGARIAGLDRLG